MRKLGSSLFIGMIVLLSSFSLQASDSIKKWAGTWKLRGAYRTQCTMNLVYTKNLHKCKKDEETQTYDIKCALTGKILFSQGFEHTVKIIDVDHSSGPNGKLIVRTSHPHGEADWTFEWAGTEQLTGDGPLFKMKGKRDFAATCDPFNQECPNIDPMEKGFFDL